MPLLRNGRHERFAQFVASGHSYEVAYEKAGYRRNDANACRLRYRDDVSARIDELLSHAAAKNGVTVDRIVAELAKIAFASADDFFEWTANSVTLKPKEQLTADQRAVVAEISETRTENGGSIKLKLSDKQAALEKLGRHLGMFREKIEIDATVKDVSPRERIASRIAGLAARRGKG